MTYVCITGNESNPEDLRRRLEKVMHTSAPLLAELRLDYLGLTPSECFKFLLSLPEDWSPRLVLTQRLAASGALAQGRCRWDIPSWQNWWREAMRLRPWYAVDLDWLVIDELANESISWPFEFRSKHALFSLHGALPEIERSLPDLVASAKLHRVGVKIAAPVRGAHDLAQLARLRKQIAELPIHVCSAMGQVGRPWRWSRLAGNISYFVLDENSITAQGQDTLEHVLPYLKERRFPDLYLLWSTDPLNRRGEEEWNRVFKERGLRARYFNVAAASEDFDPSLTREQKQAWAKDALFWMDEVGAKGASVTRPFKEVFPLALPQTNFASLNTLIRKDVSWGTANTDGSAVLKLLRERGARSALVIGSGGTAQGLAEHFRAHDFPFRLWKRNKEGQLPPMEFAPNEAFVSTWPAEYQSFLLEEFDRLRIAPQNKPLFCIDAQLKLTPAEAPLALWCEAHKIPYCSGPDWWREQAREQEKLWGLAEASPSAQAELLEYFPRSKSETIRALWISLVRPGRHEIKNPSEARDALVVRDLITSFGAKISGQAKSWIIESPTELKIPSQILETRDCGAALRMLLPWSCVLKKGALQVQADGALQRRPIADFFSALKLERPSTWPLEINCGQDFPASVSLGQSSQFASGFLIAAAAMLVRNGRQRISFRLEGPKRSLSYLQMTARMLEEAGFRVALSGDEVSLAQASEPRELTFSINYDASALAYGEVLLNHLGWPSFLPWQQVQGTQGDANFPALLAKLKNEEALDLADTPDLAPPLWLAAFLERKKLRIEGAPQLRWKESDRAAALAHAAQALGVETELTEEGLALDAYKWRVPLTNTVLHTYQDHRLAMSFGILGFFFPAIRPSERESVSKSFPRFWEFLAACAKKVL